MTIEVKFINIKVPNIEVGTVIEVLFLSDIC